MYIKKLLPIVLMSSSCLGMSDYSRSEDSYSDRTGPVSNHEQERLSTKPQTDRVRDKSDDNLEDKVQKESDSREERHFSASNKRKAHRSSKKERDYEPKGRKHQEEFFSSSDQDHFSENDRHRRSSTKEENPRSRRKLDRSSDEGGSFKGDDQRRHSKEKRQEVKETREKFDSERSSRSSSSSAKSEPISPKKDKVEKNEKEFFSGEEGTSNEKTLFKLAETQTTEGIIIENPLRVSSWHEELTRGLSPMFRIPNSVMSLMTPASTWDEQLTKAQVWKTYMDGLLPFLKIQQEMEVKNEESKSKSDLDNLLSLLRKNPKMPCVVAVQQWDLSVSKKTGN